MLLAAAAAQPLDLGAVSRRLLPGARPRRPSGPNATRSSASTPWPDRIAHPPHLALAPLADRDLEQARPTLAHPCRSGAAVIELDALAQRLAALAATPAPAAPARGRPSPRRSAGA